MAVGGPADRAYLTGSAGADVFVGTPTYAYLYGAGYFNQADGFGVALAVGAGGGDRAYLYDGPGNDVFVGTPSYAYLYGAGFFNQANGFPVVVGYSTAGGTDYAYLYDSPGNDVFVGTPTYAYLYGPGFFNQVNGFKVVSAYSTGGSDTAYLYDSAGQRRVRGDLGVLVPVRERLLQPGQRLRRGLRLLQRRQRRRVPDGHRHRGRHVRRRRRLRLPVRQRLLRAGERLRLPHRQPRRPPLRALTPGLFAHPGAVSLRYNRASDYPLDAHQGDRGCFSGRAELRSCPF